MEQLNKQKKRQKELEESRVSSLWLFFSLFASGFEASTRGSYELQLQDLTPIVQQKGNDSHSELFYDLKT